MLKYLTQENIPNENYVFERIWFEGRNIREKFSKRKATQKDYIIKESRIILTFIKRTKKRLFKRKIPLDSLTLTSKQLELVSLEWGGEIHQWMYDRYSLTEPPSS